MCFWTNWKSKKGLSRLADVTALGDTMRFGQTSLLFQTTPKTQYWYGKFLCRWWNMRKLNCNSLIKSSPLPFCRCDSFNYPGEVSFCTRAAKSLYHWYRRYKEAKWFEGKKCLFSTHFYTFLRANLRYILVVVRGSKIYFCSPGSVWNGTCNSPFQKFQFLWRVLIHNTPQGLKVLSPVSQFLWVRFYGGRILFSTRLLCGTAWDEKEKFVGRKIVFLRKNMYAPFLIGNSVG